MRTTAEPPRPKAAPVEPAGPSKTPAPRSGGILIGTLAAALLAVSAAGGYLVWDRTTASNATVAAMTRMQHDLLAMKSGLDSLRSTSDVTRQDESIRTLKKSVDTLRAELDNSRTANATALSQLATKFDKTDHDPSAKLADIASRLDKIENPAAKLGDITARLDRIERQVSSPTPTGTIAQPSAHAPVIAQVQQVSATPAVDKPASKPAPLGSWILRDVYDGVALVEGRSGGIREVTPGTFLPGAGEVRAIERHGRNWIVVTSRGIIDDSTW